MDQASEQERITKLLDEHFSPMLKEEWGNSISIFEIGCRPKDGKLGEVIVWLRTTNIIDHVKGLMVPSDPMMILDPLSRNASKLDDDDDPCRRKGDTVLVRLLKQVESDTEGEVHLMVELFQVFPTEDDAEDAHDKLSNITSSECTGN